MRDLMTKVLKDILSNADKDVVDEKILKFKKEMKTVDFGLISLPTGVSNLNKYIDKSGRGKFNDKTIFTKTKKSTPVHVKAAIKYNDLLKYFGLGDTEPMRNKEKIKWTYLKSNPLGIDALAFKGYDDPKEITDFIKQYIDYDRLFEGALQKKIKMFYEALNWELPVDKINTLQRFF